MGETTDKNGQRPCEPATSMFTYASAEDELIASLDERPETDGPAAVPASLERLDIS
ncbi:MAG: hypothetical protein ACLPN6_27660 [Streptosporangiaceae bacterium]